MKFFLRHHCSSRLLVLPSTLPGPALPAQSPVWRETQRSPARSEELGLYHVGVVQESPGHIKKAQAANVVVDAPPQDTVSALNAFFGRWSGGGRMRQTETANQ